MASGDGEQVRFYQCERFQSDSYVKLPCGGQWDPPPCRWNEIMPRDPTHEEMNEIDARNDTIAKALENDLMEISRGLSERIATADSEGDIGKRAMYELMRAVLDGAFHGALCISLESADGLRHTLHDNIMCVNMVDDIIDERLNGVTDKKWLGYSVRQYLKDYLYGACTILEKDRLAGEKEILEDISAMADCLRDMLLMRASCTAEDFEGNRLCDRPRWRANH